MKRRLPAIDGRPILVQLVVSAYIAFAVLPGPRRAPVGLEIVIVLGIAALLVGVLVNLPRLLSLPRAYS